MGNLADRIIISTTHNEQNFTRNLVGKHLVQTTYTMDDMINIGQNEASDYLKSKIIIHFYGKILKELNDILGTYGAVMNSELRKKLYDLKTKIHTGEITDEDYVDV
jgi:hypothetical protein